MRIAIVEANILACIGLERILKQLIPIAEVEVCESFEQLQQKEDQEYVHYFVSSRIYFEHTTYFRAMKGKSIILVNGAMTINGAQTLNVCQGEAALIRGLLDLQRHGHSHEMPPEAREFLSHVPALSPHSPALTSHATAQPSNSHSNFLLSAREMEVALLLCQGHINKEIADRLNISLATVITHRKNIMEKLGARSLADVIIYCVLNGIFLV